MLLSTTRESRSRASRDVDGVVGARDRADPSGSALASRARPQPGVIPAQRRGVREEEMRDQDWLRGPQVRIRRHQRVPAVPPARTAPRDRGDGALEPRNPAAEIQAQIQRDLFVPRASGVEASAGIADAFDQLPFHEAVHVLVVARDPRRIRPCRARGSRQRRSMARASSARQHAGILQRAPTPDCRAHRPRTGDGRKGRRRQTRRPRRRGPRRTGRTIN